MFLTLYNKIWVCKEEIKYIDIPQHSADINVEWWPVSKAHNWPTE